LKKKIEIIRDKITTNNLPEAFVLLQQLIVDLEESWQKDSIRGLTVRFRKINEAKQSHTVSHDQSTVDTNKLIQDVLAFLSELDLEQGLEISGSDESESSEARKSVQETSESRSDSNKKDNGKSWSKLWVTLIITAIVGPLIILLADHYLSRQKSIYTYPIILENEGGHSIDWKKSGVNELEIRYGSSKWSKNIRGEKVIFEVTEKLDGDSVLVTLIGVEELVVCRRKHLLASNSINRILVCQKTKPKVEDPKPQTPNQGNSAKPGNSKMTMPKMVYLGIYCSDIEKILLDGNQIFPERKNPEVVYVKVPEEKEFKLTVIKTNDKTVVKDRILFIEAGTKWNFNCATDSFYKL
jgi:hypothetical protein